MQNMQLDTNLFLKFRQVKKTSTRWGGARSITGGLIKEGSAFETLFEFAYCPNHVSIDLRFNWTNSKHTVHCEMGNRRRPCFLEIVPHCTEINAFIFFQNRRDDQVTGG